MLPLPPEQEVPRPLHESPEISRQEPEKVGSRAVAYGLVHGEVTPQPPGVAHHPRAEEEVRVVDHVLAVYDLAPHRKVPDVLYPHAPDGVNIVVAAIAEDAPEGITALHHADEMVPRVVDPQQVPVVRIVLVAVVVVEEGAVAGLRRTPLQVLHEPHVQGVVVVQVGREHAPRPQPRHGLLPEDAGEVATVAGLNEYWCQLRTGLPVAVYPAPVSLRGHAVEEHDPLEVAARLGHHRGQAEALEQREPVLQPPRGPHGAPLLVLLPQQDVEAGQQEVLKVSPSVHSVIAFFAFHQPSYRLPAVLHPPAQQRAGNHLQVLPEGVVVQVVAVDTHLVGPYHPVVVFLHGADGAALPVCRFSLFADYLPDPCQQGLLVAVLHRRGPRDARPEPQQLAVVALQAVGIARHVGARPHQAHVTLQYVPQLWQLVKLAPAEEGRGPRHPHRAVGALLHRPELVDGERPSVAAHPHLPEQHRPAGQRQPHVERRGQQHRPQQEQPQGRGQAVEDIFLRHVLFT